MAWSCPECSRSHELPHKKCTCGYAYYEILGVKDDTPPDSVEQTYHYLLKVWKRSADAQDPHVGSRAVARLKKINDAHAVFLQVIGSTRKGARDSTTVKFAVIGGIGLIMFVSIRLFPLLSFGQRFCALGTRYRPDTNDVAGEDSPIFACPVFPGAA